MSIAHRVGRCGHTLIEMLVVITILSMLSTAVALTMAQRPVVDMSMNARQHCRAQAVLSRQPTTDSVEHMLCTPDGGVRRLAPRHVVPRAIGQAWPSSKSSSP